MSQIQPGEIADIRVSIERTTSEGLWSARYSRDDTDLCGIIGNADLNVLLRWLRDRLS